MNSQFFFFFFFCSVVVECPDPNMKHDGVTVASVSPALKYKGSNSNLQPDVIPRSFVSLVPSRFDSLLRIGFS